LGEKGWESKGKIKTLKSWGFLVKRGGGSTDGLLNPARVGVKSGNKSTQNTNGRRKEGSERKAQPVTKTEKPV